MSWNIEIYAEYLNDNTWELIGDEPIFDSYKFYKIEEVDSCISRTSTENCSDKIKSIYSEGMSNISYCNIVDFIQVHKNCIEKFINSLKTVYKALGLQLDTDYGDSVYESSYSEESSSEYVAQLFSLMTFPVNKDLLRNLTCELNEAMKAKYMLGVCSRFNNDIDDNKQIRLIFITV